MKPLDQILVIDFSQFLSGPSASLRLADLGARVIKIERPDGGDICRTLYISNTEINGESTIFHAINRNKESYAANIKKQIDLEKIKQLIKKADVMIHNFRPGVMDRLGLDYESVIHLNPQIVYGEITGYGKEGPWKDKPGQDLLLQSLSGLIWRTNEKKDDPVPLGLAVVDTLTGTQLAQGILACLVRKNITNQGGLVEVNMLESILDAQSEMFTHFLNQSELISHPSEHKLRPWTSEGIYTTSDSLLCLGYSSLNRLGEILESSELKAFTNQDLWNEQHDKIHKIINSLLQTQPISFWLELFNRYDIPCSKVLNWEEMEQEEGFQVLKMEQHVKLTDGTSLKTTRCPVRIDSERLTSEMGAPSIGEHNETIANEFQLN